MPFNGYTGHAIYNAASSYDMYINLETTYLNGGWMYFKINGDSYMQLSGGDNKVTIYKDTTVSGHLDVGVGASSSKIDTHSNQQGYTAVIELHSQSPWISKLGFLTAHPTPRPLIFLKGSTYVEYNSNHTIIHFKSLVNGSDDRLKEDEELIENACETLCKLKPQLYDKKPDIDNDDHTAWYKEGVLIAQEIYYDVPELRHLVHRGSPELDEEGIIIPLPEIPTSIDPQKDPDYSSWDKDPASVKYIGLIAYLVKASNGLHERVKTLESK